MYKKYIKVVDYENDLRKSMNLINESLKNIENEMANKCIEKLYFNSRTSAGLSFLLKKFNIDSNLLANRLKVTNGLISTADITYSEYRETTNLVLSEFEERQNKELKICKNSLYKTNSEDNLLLTIKVYILEVYLYIIKNVFIENYLKTCEEKKSTLVENNRKSNLLDDNNIRSL